MLRLKLRISLEEVKKQEVKNKSEKKKKKNFWGVKEEG